MSESDDLDKLLHSEMVEWAWRVEVRESLAEAVEGTTNGDPEVRQALAAAIRALPDDSKTIRRIFVDADEDMDEATMWACNQAMMWDAIKTSGNPDLARRFADFDSDYLTGVSYLVGKWDGAHGL